MRIRCAICDKPVNRWEHWRNEEHMMQTIKVYCHGDTDSMKLSDFDLAHMTREQRSQLENQEGVAFTTKRLTSA